MLHLDHYIIKDGKYKYFQHEINKGFIYDLLN